MEKKTGTAVPGSGVMPKAVPAVVNNAVVGKAEVIEADNERVIKGLLKIHAAIETVKAASDKRDNELTAEVKALGTTLNGALSTILEEIGHLREELDEVKERIAGVSNPGNPGTANFVGQQFVDFTTESIVMTIGEDGQPSYKLKGFPFMKFGVRVWPEVLPTLGVDVENLKPGANPFSATVRAVLNQDGKPKKVISKTPA